MTTNILEMDRTLLGRDNLRGPFSPLERARICAQVLGPNCQDGVSQAVQAHDRSIQDATNIAQAMGFEDPYALFSWMSFNIAKGDPNCGNYFTWAGLTFEGNIPVFTASMTQLNQVLKEYNPYRTPIHSELTEILETMPGSIHFSSQRIPHLLYKSGLIQIIWPGDLSGIVGTPPLSVPTK